MTKFLYITSSSFSGSTLLSFLLNAHPDITTVGETDGWNYGRNEVFPCSCRAPLSECPFFRTIAAAFANEGLPFDQREFGTRYCLARGARLNRYLTAELPWIGNSALETIRDQLVWRVPPFARRLARQDHANRVFVRSALAASGAQVFVDACKSPYRLRHLRRLREFDVHVLHLARDPRGVALSNMKKKGYDAALAIRLWIREQVAICRIAEEFPKRMTVYYEDLCEAVNDAVAAVHDFIGVRPLPAPADFRSIPHHILGNEMRLAAAAAIVKDARWRRELSAADLGAVAVACAAFRQRRPDHPVSEMIAKFRCDVLEPRLEGQGPQSPSRAAALPAADGTVVQDIAGGL
jgi:Sulfotransferase family